MTTIGLILAYDGTPFSGWQYQEGKPTVQGCLNDALSRIHNKPVTARAASRTDAGVHAEWQIAAFDTDKSYTPDRWKMALNATTPPEIIIRHALIAPDGFQPRFESRGKHYRYWLYPGYYLPPFLLHRAALCRPLDIDNMREAAKTLIGEHDFSSFRAIDCQAKSPIRTITRLDISQIPGPYIYPCAGTENLIQIDVEGTAFLKQMVRIIVGTLIEFGLGRSSHEMKDILESRSRTNAGQTAPAAGLTLVRSYSSIDDLLENS